MQALVPIRSILAAALIHSSVAKVQIQLMVAVKLIRLITLSAAQQILLLH